MEHLSNDHEDHPNQHKNSHKLCDEMEHPVVNLMESQSVNGNGDSNMIISSQWREIHCRTNTSYRRKKEIQNRTMRITFWGPRLNKLKSLTGILQGFCLKFENTFLKWTLITLLCAVLFNILWFIVEIAVTIILQIMSLLF